jgi:phytoene desaturase
MAQLHKIDAFRTLHAANARRFRSPKMVQLFDRFATYNGSNPYVAPATLNIIPHLEHHFGAWFPEGGMAQIPLSLSRLAMELGVTFRLNTRVEKILIAGRADLLRLRSATGARRPGAVKGVQVNGQAEAADLVVSNMDVVPTYRHLLPGQSAPEFTLNQPRSGSAVIFYWGMNTTFPQLDSHNIFFASDYEAEFRAVWERQTLADDVTTYVFVSSKHVPTDAPAGGENWFVLVNAPANTGQDWDALIARTRANVLAQVSASLGRDVAAHIVAEDVLDPRTIESRTSSYQGALYGSSSNNKFAAFLRHPNFSQRLEGLYFCGGSVHPGGGIPLCLLSAKIVGDLVG